MSTPQDELDDLMRSVPSAPAAPARGLRIEARRPPKVRAPALPAASSVPAQRDELDDILDASPVRAGASTGAATGDELDGMLGEMPGASSGARRRSYGAYEAFQPEGSTWSIEHAGKVKEFYRSTFGRDLPVSAFGQSGTHNRMGLDHSQSMDVPLTPVGVEGRRLAEYLKANNIPFLAFDRAIKGAATGAHFHIGHPSRGLGAGGVAAPAAGDELDDLLGELPQTSEPLIDDDQVTESINVNANAGTAQPAALPVRSPQTFDISTTEGRARRDAQKASESDPNVSARLSVQLPVEYSKLSTREVAEMAARNYACSEGLPEAFANEWLSKHPEVNLYGRDGKPAELLDVLGSPSFDEATRTLNVTAALPKISQMKRDYAAARSPLSRSVDWATDDTTTAGEKFLDVAAPLVGAAGRVGDVATRPLQATSTSLWSLARKHSPTEAASDAWTELKTGATPAGAGNLLAEKVRASETLRGINENLPGMLSGVVEMITDPANLIPLGMMARGGQYLRTLKGVREVERLMLGARDARFLEFYNAGGRILKIEAAPFDEVADVASVAASQPPRYVTTLIDGQTHYGVEEGGIIKRLEPAEVDELSEMDISRLTPDEFKSALVEADGAPASPALVVTLEDPHGNTHRLNTKTGHLEEAVTDDPLSSLSPELRLDRDSHVKTVGELDEEIKAAESTLERGTNDAGEPLTDAKIADLQVELQRADELKAGYEHLLTVIDEHAADMQKATMRARYRETVNAPLTEPEKATPQGGVNPTPAQSAAPQFSTTEVRLPEADAGSAASVSGAALPDLSGLATASADEWRAFAPDTGTLNIPRVSMPQIKSEHRGALVQFLKGHGITHRQIEVAPSALKPSQAEFSPAKVEKARGFEGTPRSILVSSDGHVLDGHHQWLSALHDAPDVPLTAIQLDAPAHQLLIEAARFPSSGVDDTSKVVASVGGGAASDALPDAASGLSKFADARNDLDDLDQIIDEIPDDPNLTEFIPSNPNPAPYVAPAPAISPRLRAAARTVSDVLNFPKALRASFDWSGLLNQGGIIAAARPSLIKGAIKDMTAATFSKEAADALKHDLLSRPHAQLGKDSGLDLTSLAGGEESFASGFAEKFIPGVRQTGRAHSAVLDSLRANAFDLYADELIDLGVTDPKAYQHIARWINDSTGRSSLGRLEPLAGVLNLPFFSPRLLVSRVQILNPVRYARMQPGARKIALREMFRATRTLGATMGLAKLAGADVGLDPLKGDFGKITHGETSYDLAGGRLRLLRFAALLANSITREQNGEKVDDKLKTAALVEKFFRAYASPTAALAIDAWKGEEFDGEPFEWKAGELDRLIPLAVADVIEGYQAAGKTGATKALPAFVGVGVNTSEPRPQPIKPTLSAATQSELDRLGLDLSHLGDNGKKNADISPHYTTEGVSGDSIKPFGDDSGVREPSGQRMDVQAAAKQLSDELEEVLSEILHAPDYAAFEDDAERRKYLETVILNTKKRVMNGVRLEARHLEIEKEKKVEERLDRMESNSRNRGRIRFKL